MEMLLRRVRSTTAKFPGWLRTLSPQRDGGVSTATFIFMLAVIVLVSVALRWSEIWDHLPYVNDYDEFQVFWNASHMFGQGLPFSPHFFGRGHVGPLLALLSDLPTNAALVVTGRKEWADPFTPLPNYEFSVGYSEFLLVNRCVWLGASVSTLVATALLGSLMVGRWVGLGAAFIVALNPFHAELSSRIEADGLATAFATWTLFVCVLALKRNRLGLLYWGAIFAGLACGTKFNYGTVLVTVLATGWVMSRQSAFGPAFWGLIIRLLVVFAGTFAVTTPSIFLYPVQFIRQLGFQVIFYSTSEGFSEPGLAQARYQASELAQNFGVAVILMGLLGSIFLLLMQKTRTIFLIILVGFLPFLVFMLSSRVNYHRNWLLLYPVIAIAGATGVWIVSIIIFERYSRTAMRDVAGILVYVSLLIGLSFPSFKQSIESISVQRDTRTVAMQSVWRSACDRGVDVVVDEMLLLNAEDRTSPCGESLLVEANRESMMNGFGEESFRVICGTEGEGNVFRAQGRDVAAFASAEMQSRCRFALTKLWNNPPLIDPPVLVIGPSNRLEGTEGGSFGHDISGPSAEYRTD
jgi:4-amino-4-deoxy-L-arabinose transferase-like glycosyltransferase